MAHVGEIGKRMTAAVTFVKSFDYVDYKFNPRGDVHYTHIFHDADGAARFPHFSNTSTPKTLTNLSS